MKQRPLFLPPMWLALLLSMMGIFGMNLVYQSVADGGLVKGLVGGVLLAIAVTSVGTPLAFSYTARRKFREGTKKL